VKRRESTYGIAVVLLVTALGMTLTAQGWRSRMVAFDFTTYIHGIHRFLATGVLPQHGDIGSYGSFKPAGTAWLMLPSTVLSPDPRLADYAGTTLLHLATLLGIFLLARKFFSVWCGCIAVVLYGLSAEGLFLAGSLWPNGRPDFFVWMVFLASLWVARRDGRYLAGAIAVWGAGMQVDMGLTPALFLLPALWLVYRPPVRVTPLLAAAALLAVVWYPYVRFEAPRHFVDIRSQQLFQNITPADYKRAWCDPQRNFRTAARVSAASASRTPTGVISDAAGSTGTGAASSAVDLAHSIFTDKIVSNFRPIANLERTASAISYVLVVLVVVSLLFWSVYGANGGGGPPLARQAPWYRRFTTMTAAGVVVAFAVHELVRVSGSQLGVSGSLFSAVERFTKLLVLGGLTLLVANWAGAALSRALARAGVPFQTPEEAVVRRVLVLCLAVPWFILLVVAEPGKPERFWWLWPLQVLFLAAFAIELLPRLGLPRAASWLLQGALVVVIVGNSFLSGRLESWQSNGWSGRDADEVQAIDYVSRRLHTAGRDRAAIGYNVYFYPFMAKYHVINPEYKVGADFDVMFRYRYGITNTDTCAEGFSVRDEYRIVQRAPLRVDEAATTYFDARLHARFRKLRQFGTYEVFKRVSA
jgi:hypothetical protein